MSRMHLLARRLLTTILGVFAGAAALIWAPAYGAQVDEPHLISIPMYRYPGTTVNAPQLFAFFEEILADKLRMLTTRFEGVPEGQYLEHLSVSEVVDSAPPSTAEIRRHWLNESALEVMHGIIVQRPDGYWVISHIFIGELGNIDNHLGSEDLMVELRISEDEYASIADGHSLVTLFALAMDAKRLKMPPFLVLRLLSAADDVFADIMRHARPNQRLDPDVWKTHEAVMRVTSDMRTR
jgi:hypothetical protein